MQFDKLEWLDKKSQLPFLFFGGKLPKLQDGNSECGGVKSELCDVVSKLQKFISGNSDFFS